MTQATQAVAHHEVGGIVKARFFHKGGWSGTPLGAAMSMSTATNMHTKPTIANNWSLRLLRAISARIAVRDSSI